MRFGVIGTNFITDWVIEGGREDRRFELTAVCSRTLETAQAFARKHGIPHVFTSVEEMAASPLIDAVYVASPNVKHAEQTIICLKGRKHVLCEKAFASNFSEAEVMIRTAVKNDVALMEAMKPTLTPAFRAVMNHIGDVGRLRRYFASYCQYSSRYDKFKEGVILNAFNPALSNGATMDIGVYTIYPMVTLFGRPRRIQATGVLLSNGIDAQATVNFEYADGLIATVLYGKIADSTLPVEIQGEEGTILLDRINIISEARLIRRRGETRDIRPVTRHNEYYYEIAEFIDVIESGRRQSEINTHANSLATMEIMDEIRRQLN